MHILRIKISSVDIPYQRWKKSTNKNKDRINFVSIYMDIFNHHRCKCYHKHVKFIVCEIEIARTNLLYKKFSPKEENVIIVFTNDDV